MKHAHLYAVVMVGAVVGAAWANTISEVQFDGAVTSEMLSQTAGVPVTLEHGADGSMRATLPDEAVRRLAAEGISLQVIRTHTTVSPMAETKSLESVTVSSNTSFPINPANSQTLSITGAPEDAVVSSVTIRVRGTAAFADLCTFELRDAATISYTLPAWFDMVSFDRTVSGITAFNGRPVNQAWTLWAQGGNVAGERVDQWWITVFYETDEVVEGEVAEEGEVEGETEGEVEGEGEPPAPGVFIVGRPNVEIGKSVSLKAVLMGIEGADAYQWYKDGMEIEGAAASEYYLPNATDEDTGEYHVEVTANGDVYASAPFPLTVWPEGSLTAWSFPMLAVLMVVMVTMGGIGIFRRRPC